jgi:ecdysteroid 2-hydroxylase
LLKCSFQTVHTVEWLLHSIAQDQELYRRLRENADDANTLEAPLVRGCLREVMRLYPVAPFIGRFVDLNADIGGYFIPKGTLVLASLYSSGRDPINFSDPHKFIPDRWLRNEECEHKVFKSHASIPFAMGSRSCIGKKIALYQIHSLVTKVTTTTK